VPPRRSWIDWSRLSVTLGAGVMLTACMAEFMSGAHGGPDVGAGGSQGEGGALSATGGEPSDGLSGSPGNGSTTNGSGGSGSGVGGTFPSGPTEVASRLEGVAPLFVFFDATGGFTDDSYMDCTFQWEFDVDDADPNGRHETLAGFIAGHVYERPGTYRTRRTTYRDGAEPETQEWTITAREFDGETIYVSSTGDDANSGSIDAPIASVNEALEKRAQPNTRILFRNGDTFQFETAWPASSGPVIVSGYSDPSSPSTEMPTLLSTSADNAWFGIEIGGADWRLVGLRITSNGHTTGPSGPRYPGGVNLRKGSLNSLLLDMDFVNLGTIAINLAGQGHGIFDSTLHTIGGYGLYGEGDEMTNRGNAIIGNRAYEFDCDAAGHIVRTQGGSRLYFGDNNFQANETLFDSIQIRGNTNHVVIYKNILNYEVGFHPQNFDFDERIHHCLLDSNLLYDGGVKISAKRIVARNNIFDGKQGISIEEYPLSGPSADVRIHYNTFTCDSSPCRVTICDTCTDVVMESNLDDPAFTSAVAPDVDITDTALTIDDLAMTDEWVPPADSEVVDEGETGGVALDFYGEVRDANPDLGAVEAVP
jgi:hypothetical protein